MADKPNVTTTLASLRKEITKPEVFKLGLSGGKVITFPDLYDMESQEAEEVFGSLNQNMTNWAAIRQWLSTEDADKLAAEKLSIRELGVVMSAAVSHYEGKYGEQGEGSASAS